MASLRDALRAHGLDVLEHTVDWDATGTTYRLQLHHRAALDAESLTNSLTQRFRPAGLVGVRWCQRAGSHFFLWMFLRTPQASRAAFQLPKYLHAAL
jgi:hypothetical protein